MLMIRPALRHHVNLFVTIPSNDEDQTLVTKYPYRSASDGIRTPNPDLTSFKMYEVDPWGASGRCGTVSELLHAARCWNIK